MKVLMINKAWDAAGCSFRQAAAVNKYADCKVRHFRAVKTFYDYLDLGPENYKRDEFVSILEESDILHFCSADHNYTLDQGFRATLDEPFRSHKWGFEWKDKTKGKACIFHCYNSFPGRWDERAKLKDWWNRRKGLGYSAIWSSIPQAVYVYDGCTYMPDLVDEQLPEFTPDAERDYSRIKLGHFPTGGGNNKNTAELRAALALTTGVDAQIASSLPNAAILHIKKSCNLGFDAIWRGFHGATTVENLALGIPTMCGTDKEFVDTFKKFHGTDEFPIDITNNVNEIAETIEKYKDAAVLEARCKQVRKFMKSVWSAKNIAERMVAEYKKLLERK